MKLYLKRKFSAAHHLPHHKGKCALPHGHTWKVEVWIEGEVKENGMVVDFGEVKAVIDRLDHSDLNVFFSNPSAEFLASYFLSRIPLSKRVRVWESKHAYAEAEHVEDDTPV